jgi:hypothetical protein
MGRHKQRGHLSAGFVVSIQGWNQGGDSLLSMQDDVIATGSGKAPGQWRCRGDLVDQGFGQTQGQSAAAEGLGWGCSAVVSRLLCGLCAGCERVQEPDEELSISTSPETCRLQCRLHRDGCGDLMVVGLMYTYELN